MEFYQYAQHISIVVGAVTACWALIRKLNSAFIKHLDASFASRADFHRVEKKLDRVIHALDHRLALRQRAPRAHSKKSANIN